MPPARANADGLDSLYDDRLASKSQRLTAVIQEVKELAERSGIEPNRIWADTLLVANISSRCPASPKPVTSVPATISQSIAILASSC